ncbi:putative inactive purple acid phosphatase 16 [Heracleum sosnowskyi]|uniref:Inactive purple acid phosphatase 16 n=1 Tax=Heracleum sosnowskyi TaxID=360622 RepID=A0AAD8MBK3_9APIA|nr:putative inactive purple acid phosphatase 16 [Heracleum sosnowskyi]
MVDFNPGRRCSTRSQNERNVRPQMRSNPTTSILVEGVREGAKMNEMFDLKRGRTLQLQSWLKVFDQEPKWAKCSTSNEVEPHDIHPGRRISNSCGRGILLRNITFCYQLPSLTWTMILSVIFSTLLLSSQIFTVSRANNGDDQRNVTLRTTAEKYLQITKGSSFKIAIFADLHFGEDAWTLWGPQQDIKSVKVMSTILDNEHPDFVVYLGDVITANNIPIKNASLYWNQALSPTRARNTPWASVFGNHDDASFEWPLEWFSATGIPPVNCSVKISGELCRFKGTSRLMLMKNEIEHNAFSYSRRGPSNLWPSISNYVLQVSSSSDSQVPVAFMYFFDSGGGSYPEILSTAQAEWFRVKSQQINPDARVPEIIFWHIPSKAYKKVAPKFKGHKHCVGSMFTETVAPQEAEMGMMKILRGRSSVKAVFVGHNHGLDWCCPDKKLWLCFSRHTGYGGYGNWPRGSRILEITQEPFSLKSWIRMEDGHKHSDVLLSS